MSDIRLTPVQVAERLGVSKKTVYRLLESREIGYLPIGRKKVIPEAEVEAYEQRVFVPARPSADVIPLRHREVA